MNPAPEKMIDSQVCWAEYLCSDVVDPTDGTDYCLTCEGRI